MAVYPDEYTILDVYLRGIPSSIFTELLTTIGLSPEINSLEEFVAYAKEVEQRTKTEAYYRQLRMPRSEMNATKGQDKTGNKVAPAKPRETTANKSPFKRYNTPYTNKRPQYKTHDKRKSASEITRSTCYIRRRMIAVASIVARRDTSHMSAQSLEGRKR